ncbi:D-aminoacid aminotransferase-like PLP-dependent enzyme [Teratosphaeria nubilosa]|uniref:D-aminoacid aminotransferase-like PLP-dependent enzyme n=1 Tax=Teratosphaeria nubilosa TaxID=161662 RepID=A0A6G1LEM7_9PEZI|nr:D-aminoacid aminotransferase-like PLP-dependent enzyme [Teratosphaeria nubilosa]
MSTMHPLFTAYATRQAALATSTNPYAHGIAWISNTYAPLPSARIPLMDQGFLRSDLTYDVISVWDGRFFRLDDHLSRIASSCTKLRMQLPLGRGPLRAKLVEMVARSGLRDAYVEVIVTRGLKGVRGTRAEEHVNALYLFAQPYVWVMPPEVQMAGTGSAVVARTVRRIPPGAVDPTVKNLMWGDFTRGMWEASDRGAQHPVLTDGDGNLTEGSGFNVCVVKGGVVFTPDRGVLEGVTRRSVFDVAGELGVGVRKEVVPVEWCYRADEIFLCTTAGGIMPVTRLDGVVVGDGRVGSVTKRIWDGYWRMHYDERFSFAVEYDDEASRAKL